jgi:predicted nucleotidyltransferase component of viral defense system
MRALYDPPFFFEWTPTCLTVYKRDNDVYTKYRMLSQGDAKRIYPDVMHWLENTSTEKEQEAFTQVADKLEAVVQVADKLEAVTQLADKLEAVTQVADKLEAVTQVADKLEATRI